MNPHRIIQLTTGHRRIRVAVLLLAATLLSAVPRSPAAGEDAAATAKKTPGRTASEAVSQAAGTAPQIVPGITGHFRVGHWTAVRIGEQVELAKGSDIAIETVDGDGGRAVFRQATIVDRSSGPNVSGRYAYCIPGGEAVPLVLRDGSRMIVSTRFAEPGSPSRGPAPVPSAMPWVVAIGDPLGIETIGENELLDRDPQVAVSIPATADQLPDRALGYHGVDLVVVNSAGLPLLSDLGPAQAAALSDWVRAGGRLFLCLGASASELLSAAPWLYDLLPIERGDGVATQPLRPSALENYMSSQTRLKGFGGAILPKRSGRILVSGRTLGRESTPFAAEYVSGLGRVLVVAADLHQPTFSQWPERLPLIVRLTGDQLVAQDEPPQRSSRPIAFEDLAGQMRTTLDRFPLKRPISFAVITLILIGLVAVIGPLDYWLVNRVMGRPAVGWITFPTVAVALSAALAYQTRPAETAAEGNPAMWCNRLEIVDVDAIDGIARGFAWSCVYSHPARRVDLSVRPAPALTSLIRSPQLFATGPFGWPGPSFGGIQIAGEDDRMPPYEVDLTRRPVPSRPADARAADADREVTETGAAPSAGGRGGDSQRAGPLFTSLHGLPLAPRSSKSLTTRFRFEASLDRVPPLQRRLGSELLEGSFPNPLPFDLLDGMLIYRNWAYLLPTRFPAGATIDSLGNLRQKNFRWRLSRQKAIEQATQSQAWEPTDFDSPERVAEMLMFHDAVGGTRYTSLEHQPLGFLDLTHLLTRERAMLVGRLDQPLSRITIRESGRGGDGGDGGDGDAGEEDGGGETRGEDRTVATGGRTTTLLRLVVPVAAPDSQR